MGTITRGYANLITATGPNAIADGSIVNADVSSSASIDTSKLGTGAVLQAVTATTTTTISVSSTTLTDTTLTASITPSSISNKILVLVCQSIQGYRDGGNYATVKWSLLRGSTAIWEAANEDNGTVLFYDYGGSGLNILFPMPLIILDSPSTTSSTTYKTQVARGNNGGTFAKAQPENNKSSITLLEIKG
jgi:hypothetical protein